MAVVTKLNPDENQVLNTLLARRDNYDLTDIAHSTGRYYDVVLKGKRHIAVVLVSSFEFYSKRYHLADILPTLCICMVHDTVLPIDCLSLRQSNHAKPYELPKTVTDVRKQRHGKTGSQVLLGMYILGMRSAQDIIFDKSFPATSRKRYLRKAKVLQRRPRGKPVGHKKKPKEET